MELITANNYPLNSTDKILKLIDKGDVISLLADESLVENFNELFKYGLIDNKNNKIQLTPTGLDARRVGMEKYIAAIKNKEELKDFSVEVQNKELKIFKFCLGLTLCVFVFLILISLTL